MEPIVYEMWYVWDVYVRCVLCDSRVHMCTLAECALVSMLSRMVPCV